MPCSAFQKVADLLDVGAGAANAALRHHIPRAGFALPALGGNTEFELNFVKTHACTGMAGDFTVGDSATDADDHGLVCQLNDLLKYPNYKCESIAFAIGYL